MNSREQSKKSGELEAGLIRQSKQEIYAGPIPHPDVLEKFGKVDSSFPERIFKMAEANNAAKIKAKKSEALSFLLSQILTFLLGIAGMASGVFLALKGYEAGGIAAIIAGFAPIVIAALKNLKK